MKTMPIRLQLLPMLILVAAGLSSAATLVPDPPLACDACAECGRTREPFNVFGNTWFVGGGLSAVLITSPRGHILVDGGLPQSAPGIADNIVKLGFKLEDVKLIVNSHTHYDHAGGIAALQRASGAQVAASPASKKALEQGGPTKDDPQFAFGHEHNDYAKVANVRVVEDGETLRVGDLAITAHFTPGHTPGGTSWTWRSCENGKCENVVYADSLNSVSAPAFRFSADPALVKAFEHSMDVVAALPCDILLAPHPELVDLDAKLAARKLDAAVNPFIGTGACRAYADTARQRLQKRLAEEASTH